MIDRVEATRGAVLSRALRETLILYQIIFDNLEGKSIYMLLKEFTIFSHFSFFFVWQ